ncbi:HAMP domain-containing protein [Candidatus Poribacteria bacterium]|nr:HAMP domain-containing protein [Candidatus Poribacteria bacterium]
MIESGRQTSRASISRGLSKKFVLPIIVGAAATIVWGAIFGYYHAYKLRREGLGASMERAAESLSAQMDTSLETAVELMTQLAASAQIRDTVAERDKRYGSLSNAEMSELVLQESAILRASKQPQALLDALKSNPIADKLKMFASGAPGFRVLGITDRAGVLMAAFGEAASSHPKPEEWWQVAEIMEHGKVVISEPTFTEKTVSATVRIHVPIMASESAGLLGGLDAEYSFDNIISQLDAEDEIVAFLLSDSNERRLYILSPPDMVASKPVEFSEKVEKVRPKEHGWSLLELEKGGGTVVAGFAPIEHSLALRSVVYQGKDWSAVTAAQESRVTGPLNSLFVGILGFSALMLVALSTGGIMLAQRTLRPIRVLQEGVQEIGQGNLEHRIDIRSGDEIEMLALEFNRMAERMQRTQEQLQRRGKELEQRVNQLRRLQAQLMQSERMAATGELAAQIAHEINNPLGIIKNYVGIAKMLMVEEDPNRENMKIVDQEINRIAGIVRRLLKFAKPGTEDIQSVQINQVLEELLALLRGQLFRRKIEISTEFAENLPEVSVSTDQMRQVFLNLIKNAEDAMSDGGKLSVRTRYRKGRVEIDIADTGCGIPSENIKNIFEPFFTTKGVKGTGLGLSVSYGIVKNYNGEISVDSEPGKGATFTIQLPVVSEKVFQVIRS